MGVLSVKIFRRRFLVSHAGIFCRANFYGVTNFGSRKVLCFRGLCHNFLSKFFLSQCREILYGNPSVICVRKFLVAKKFMDKKGGVSTFSVGNFSVTVPKNFVGELFSVSLIPGFKKFYA